MADINDVSSARAAYGFVDAKPTWGNTYESREFAANTSNSIAMALMNRDIEQKQWERNAAYNDPSAMYNRLIASGMNPVLAMQSVSGVGSSAPQSLSAQGSYSAQNHSGHFGDMVSAIAGTAHQAMELSSIIAQNRKARAEAANTEANTELVKKQASWYDREASSRTDRNTAEIDKINNDINLSKQEMPERIALLRSEAAEMVSRKELNEKQVKVFDKEIQKIEQVVKGLKLDNKFNAETLNDRKQKLAEEVANLMKKNRIDEAAAALADSGIILGADGLTTLLGIVASGKSADIVPQVTKALTDVLASLPDAIGTLISTLVDKLTPW